MTCTISPERWELTAITGAAEVAADVPPAATTAAEVWWVSHTALPLPCETRNTPADAAVLGAASACELSGFIDEWIMDAKTLFLVSFDGQRVTSRMMATLSLRREKNNLSQSGQERTFTNYSIRAKYSDVYTSELCIV